MKKEQSNKPLQPTPLHGAADRLSVSPASPRPKCSAENDRAQLPLTQCADEGMILDLGKLPREP